MTAPEKVAPIPALLPCPFCGGRAKTWVLENVEIQQGEEGQYQGGCAVACAETPWCDTLDEVAAWWNRRAARPSAVEKPAPTSEGDALTCFVCNVPFQADDICVTDIDDGTAHAACLEGSPIVDLNTGEPREGPVSTWRYGDRA